MLTPDYLLHISEGAEQISAQLHTDIIKDIVRRIQARQMRGNDYVLTATDKWQIESLMDAGYLRDDIARDIAKATGLQQTEIAEAFEDAGVKTMRYDNHIYRSAGIDADYLKMSPQMVRLMQRNYEATLGEWKNFTRTTADAAQTAFIDTMDQIYNRVLSGASGYTIAFTEAIDKLASDGLVITYPSGHRDTIETATLRCVRTGVSQASAQIQVARMDEMDIDLVVVSSHLGARPEHAVWQGKVYSRSGNSEKYPDFVSSTGYGTGAGLCGWNCRHSFSPYFEGMDNPFLDYDSEENRKAYDESQQQRAMERAIRKTKRRQEVLQDAAETAENDDIRQELNNKLAKVKERLKMQNTAYREYCDENGLRPLPERLRIAKIGRNSNKQFRKEENGSIIASGAVSGARNPYGEAAKKHADKYYGLVRSMKTDVPKVSKASGFTEEEITSVKQFIFMQKHDLGNGKLEYFEPDYMMGESWRRLIEGKPEPHDLTMIRHELLEHKLMETGLTQYQAHIEATKMYNYDKEATEFYDKIKKYRIE